MTQFKVHTPYSPAGDQPEAIEKLTASIVSGGYNTSYHLQYLYDICLCNFRFDLV